MASGWDEAAEGVLRLPSGVLIRGRALRRPLPDGLLPEFGVYLLGHEPPTVPWPSRWVRWRDFRVPTNPIEAHDALRDAWRRAETKRVEVACDGGRGRTGTALACIAVLDGVAPAEATAYVRERYDRKAVEVPWQRRFVESAPTA